MIVHQTRTSLATRQQHGQQHHADDEIHLSRSLALIPPRLLLPPSNPPAIQIHEEDGIIHQGVSNRHLDARYHGGLLFAGGIFLPGTAVLLNHADELDVAGHDGGDSGDEGGAHEEVGEPSHVELRGRGAEALGQELRFDIGSGQGVDDVDAPSEDVEGDGEVDQRRVDGVAG